jgi:hypothetical protein
LPTPGTEYGNKLNLYKSCKQALAVYLVKEYTAVLVTESKQETLV